MNLRQVTARGQSQSSDGKTAGLENPERFLTLVVEGAALGVPEIDERSYKDFRANVSKLALQLPDRLPDEEKLAQIRTVLREFESYRRAAEDESRNRTATWRLLVSFLFKDLLRSLGIDPSTAKADALLHKIGGAVAAEKVEELRGQLDSFLHPAGAGSAPAEASQFRTA